MSLCKLQSKLKTFTWISHWKLIKTKYPDDNDKKFVQQRRPIFLFKITDVFINTQKRGRVNEILDYYTDIVFLSVPQLKRFVNNKK